MAPSIGRIVLYKLFDHERKEIGGNAGSGAVVPAVIVAVHSESCVNLKTIADGPNDIWVTSRCEGSRAGEWSWPPRI